MLPVRLPHYTLETYGFRVTNGAATLAYTGDTGPSGRIAELARDADLLVCEATLETGEADGQPRGHLSAEEALEAYAASGARRLLLTHRPSELDVPDGVELAFDGLELEVEPATSDQASARCPTSVGHLRPAEARDTGVARHVDRVEPTREHALDGVVDDLGVPTARLVEACLRTSAGSAARPAHTISGSPSTVSSYEHHGHSRGCEQSPAATGLSTT